MWLKKEFYTAKQTSSLEKRHLGNGSAFEQGVFMLRELRQLLWKAKNQCPFLCKLINAYGSVAVRFVPSIFRTRI